MKLLLDQGLPRSAVFHLQEEGVDALHVGEIGLSTADDPGILEYAREAGLVVVTLDADFHALLALSGAGEPSVIRIRVEGLRGETLARLLARILPRCRKQVEDGALVTVTRNRVGLRKLPLVR